MKGYNVKYLVPSITGSWDGDVTNDFVRADDSIQPATGPGGNYTESDLFDFGETCEYLDFYRLCLTTVKSHSTVPIWQILLEGGGSTLTSLDVE